MNQRKCEQCEAILATDSQLELCAACLLKLGLEAEQGETKPGRLPAPTSRMVGPYKLLQQIGEGGMGTVWMAEQQHPVRRRVAVKLIRQGMDTRQVVARFEAERQGLAMMDHPNIARVLDAGSTEEGLPFFVMELVQGVSLTEYCDRHNLTVRERLDLFIPVCKAIQHAHQKGLIHRDLKPSNILVAIHDGQPVAKVIDFGLAKALQIQNRLTDKTLFTEFGQVVGTVQYMSPEQAELDALDVDTRSDIYSLGVILYELLTGSTPIESATLKQVALLNILQWIRENEPPRPSVRLSSSGKEIYGISRHRGADPKRLHQIICGDLDWIVMKALEKDRNRRYETAVGMADDVHRFLNDEAILARPPTIPYRLSKFAKKHKGMVVAISAILILLVAGMVGTSSGMFWAVSEKKRADKNALESSVEASKARVAEGRARGAESKAKTSAVEAIQQKAVANTRLLQLQVHAANRSLQADQPYETLTWLINALADANSFGDMHHEELLRKQLGIMLRQMPRLNLCIALDQPIGRAVFSPDGKKLSTVSQTSPFDCRIWSTDSGAQTGESIHVSGSECCAHFTPDSQRVILLTDEALQAYDCDTSEIKLGPINLPRIQPHTIAFTPDQKQVAIAVDRTTVVLDLENGQQVFPPIQHRIPVVQVEINSSGTRLISHAERVEDSCEVKLIDLANGAIVFEVADEDITNSGNFSNHRVINEDANAVRPAFSPDGTRFVTFEFDAIGRANRQTKLWVRDATTGKPIGEPFEAPNYVYRADFSNDGENVFARCKGDQLIKLNEAGDLMESWSNRSISDFHVLPGLENILLMIEKGPATTQLKLLDEINRIFVISEAMNGYPLLTSVSPDGNKVLVTTRQGLQFFDYILNRKHGSYFKFDRTPDTGCIAFHPDSQQLVSVRGGVAKIWSLAELGPTISAPAEVVATDCATILFAPKTQRLIVASGRWRNKQEKVHSIKRFDWRDVKETLNQNSDTLIEPSELLITGMPVVQLVLSPAETTGAALLADGSVMGLDATRWKETGRIPPVPGTNIETLALADGSSLQLVRSFEQPAGSARFSRQLENWNMDRVQLTSTFVLPGHSLATFSSDASRICLLDSSNSLILWQSDVKKQVEIGKAPDSTKTVRFSRDASKLLIITEDSRACIWDVEFAKRITPFRSEIDDARFSSDGRFVVAVDRDRLTKIYDALTLIEICLPIKNASTSDVDIPVLTADAQFMIGFDANRLNVWDLSPIEGDMERIESLIKIMSGHEIDEMGGYAPIETATQNRLWQQLNQLTDH